ncbi:hypothetical protein LXL04_032531 [Taraxacum kok-saghyz]
MQDDIMRFIKHLEIHGSLARGSNSSFIFLLPKVKDPLILGDYRPISLIGSLYKILAKVLANRLKRVIGSVVGENQTAFIKKRNILDGPMIINEMCNWTKKAKRKMLLFKVDFEKAFDSVNWNYLESIMLQMGFGVKWVSWIRGCLSSSRASVLINGSATKEFPISKGVRQGDPMSPFLFIIAMEGLNTVMKSATQQNLFQGIAIPNSDVSISHLFYADDALFVGEWNISNFNNLSRILRCFNASSGLKVNFHKSQVYGFGVAKQEVADCAQILGCAVGEMPFKYLGVPVGANMARRKSWQPIIERMQSRLSGWKANNLSFGVTEIEGSIPGDTAAITSSQLRRSNRDLEIWVSLLQPYFDARFIRGRTPSFGLMTGTAWKRRLKQQFELEEQTNLTGIIDSIQISTGPDKWVSKLASDGCFYVRNLRHLIDEKTTLPAMNPTVWYHLIPVKITCFVWRACRGRIPTSDALMQRNVTVPSATCHLCANNQEDVNHLFLTCTTAVEVLAWIFSWCDINLNHFSGITDFVAFAGNWGRCPKKRKILTAILYGYLWSMWKARNEKLFNNKNSSPRFITDNIVTVPEMSPPAFLDSCNGQFFSFKSSSALYSSYTDMNSSTSNSNNGFPNSNETNTISGFNSPPLAASRNPGGAAVAGPGSNLSRPRLMKMRRQASHNPRSTTASGIRRGEEADASLGFNPFRTPSESTFVNTTLENAPKRAFSFGSASSNSAPFSFQAFENDSKKNLDQSMADQLPDEINKLNIGGSGNVNSMNSQFTNTFPSNTAPFSFKDLKSENKQNLDASMVDQLPNEINKLNIGSSGKANPIKSQSTNMFPSNVETDLQHEMHKMNLGNQKGFVFGKNNKSDGNLSARSVPVFFGIKHDEDKIKADSISDRMENLKVSGSGDDFSKPFTFGTASKTSNDPKQPKKEEMKADFISEKLQDLKVSGSTFTFTSKLDDSNVEPKTPTKGLFSGVKVNNIPEAKKESVKESKLRKKKGRTRKSVTGQRHPTTQPFTFGQTSVEILEGFEAYSPMDASPYQETLADDYYYRGTSVTSDDNSQMNDRNSFSSESFIVNSNSNLTTDEDLLNATQFLDINDSDVKCEVSEAESFRSANENLEYSSETFASAFDSELSSTATSGKQEESSTSTNTSKSTPLFKFGSKLEKINKENFTFAASSSSGQSQLSPDTRQHKKKHRLKTGHDSSSSTNDFFPIPKIDVPILSSKNNDSFKSIKEQDLKHGVFSIPSASIAAEESCEKWRLRGNQAYGNGELGKAEDYYTQGLNSVPQSEKSRDCLRALMLCYSNRAATRISLGKMREALKDCLMAAAIDPNFLKVQVRAAHCYLAIGEVENATLQYMKCLQSGNDVCVDRKLLVDASEGLAKAQKVTECIKQYTELPRRTSDDLECALRVINEALQISKYSEQLLQMKADILVMLRRYEQVIQMCEQNSSSADVDTPTATSPNSWRTTLIVKSYFYLGRLEEALEFIKKQETSGQITERLESMSLDSVIPLADTVRELLSRKAAGNEAYKSGKYTEAVEHYTSALSCSVESRPFAAICFCNRAAAYRALGQISDAIADCSLAIALDPTYLKALSRRASLYEMIRDYGQAAIDLRRFVSLLTSQIQENTIVDKSSGMNELRQAQIHLCNIEEESRKELPLNMYLILGVESTADASEVKKAYRKAALKHHPDKAALSVSRSENGEDGLWREIAENVYKDADRLFKMIGEAYAVLSNPSKRSRYDMDEEMRNEANDFTRGPVFERSGSRRWQESWRPYVNTQSKGQEKSTPSYRYSRQS